MTSGSVAPKVRDNRYHPHRTSFAFVPPAQPIGAYSGTSPLVVPGHLSAIGPVVEPTAIWDAPGVWWRRMSGRLSPVVVIERMTVVGVFVMALTLGYLISGSVLGPRVLAVLVGVLAGSVLAFLFHRSFEAERISDQSTEMH